MKALSIRQPWAWLIVHGWKNIENRTWGTNFRGRFLVHASKKLDIDGYIWVQNKFPFIPLPPEGELSRGKIVGSVSIINVQTHDDGNPWFFGPYGFVLVDAIPAVSPLQYPGKLRFFETNINFLRGFNE